MGLCKHCGAFVGSEEFKLQASSTAPWNIIKLGFQNIIDKLEEDDLSLNDELAIANYVEFQHNYIQDMLKSRKIV